MLLSCPDWEARIRGGRSLVPELSLFEEEVELATAFFDSLCLPDVPGTPTLRDAAGPWFREIVGVLFGSRNPVTNERFLREIFALVPKGNSKTSYGAALMVTALLMNKRPRAEYLIVAPTQAISDLAFSQAVGMVEANEVLKRRFKVSEHVKEIRDFKRRSRLKVKTFDLNVLTGPKPAGVLLDELHLLGKHSATAKVLRQIRGGLEKNPEGFLIMITTQSDEPPAGAFRAELQMARSIRDGLHDGRMLPILYEFPPDIAGDAEKWQSPDYWPMVMPNLGRSLRLESLIRDWESERTKGEHAIRIWASQHLNLEIGLALRSDRWAGADYWEKAVEPRLTLEAILERSDVVVVGEDGGGLDDLHGLAVLGRERETRKWLAWCHAWCHVSVLERRKSEASKLLDFAQAGELTIVDDLGEDITDIVEIVKRVEDAGLLAQVGVDPVGIAALVDALDEIGINGDRIVGVSQGYRLMGAIKTIERKLVDGSLVHGGQRLMAYCVGNARIEQRGNAILVTKQASGTAKIDPLMALFDAGSLMAMNPEAQGSVYNHRGLLSFG